MDKIGERHRRNFADVVRLLVDENDEVGFAHNAMDREDDRPVDISQDAVAHNSIECSPRNQKTLVDRVDE